MGGRDLWPFSTWNCNLLFCWNFFSQFTAAACRSAITHLYRILRTFMWYKKMNVHIVLSIFFDSKKKKINSIVKPCTLGWGTPRTTTVLVRHCGRPAVLLCCNCGLRALPCWATGLPHKFLPFGFCVCVPHISSQEGVYLDNETLRRVGA